MGAKVPQVSVTPVRRLDGTLSPTEFNVTFTGQSGKEDHPALVVSEMLDDAGNPIAAASSVWTIKEPSDTFRVNPEEEWGRKQDQTFPSVAMDADGDFVIAWQSDVSDSDVFGSISLGLIDLSAP